jgi:hypothetical protein
MAQLTNAQYDILERAVVKGSRVSIRRSGRRESILVPLKLITRNGREMIEARNPTTGHDLTIAVDDIEELEALP